MIPSFPQLLILLAIAFIFIVPPVLVLSSSRSHGGAKFGWFICTLFFSWLAYAVFLIMTQKQKDSS